MRWHQELTRPLRAEDWERFDYYGRRVRELTLPGRGQVTPVILDIKLHQALSMSQDILQRSGPLLECLTSIKYDEPYRYLTDEMSPLYIQLLAGPVITDVTLSFSSHDAWIEYATVLDIVRSKCTHIKSLKLSWSPAPPHFSNHLSSLFRGMVTLHDLDCGRIVLSPQVFSHLAKLPSLRKLRCFIRDNLLSSLSLFPGHPFQALEEVKWLVVDLSSVTNIFRRLKKIPLRKIHVEVVNPPSSSSSHSFFMMVVTLCGPANVTDIHILPSEFSTSANDIPVHYLDAHSIEPLFGLPNIVSLRIMPNVYTEHITDSLVQRMVAAWPRIRLLHFAPARSLSSEVTLDGLTVFAKCRNLESLALSFKASPILDSWRNTHPGNGFSCETLKILDVGSSHIEDPESVAAVLYDIFPCLERIDVWHKSEEDQIWWDTFEAYELYAKVKQQERTFALNAQGACS